MTATYLGARLLLLVYASLSFLFAPPRTAEEWAQKAWDEGFAGNYERAIMCCNEAIKLDPNCKFCYCYRGGMKHAMGDLDDALEDLTKAVKIDPSYIDAYQWRGDVKKAKGDTKGATEDYEKAKQLRAEETQKRLDEFNKAIEAEPAKAELYRDRAYFKQSTEDLKGAIKDFERYIELAGRPDSFDVVCQMAMARTRLEDLEGAIADYTRAMEWFPDMARPYDLRAVLRRKQGDMEGVRADIAMATVKRQAQERQRRLEEIEALVALLKENPNDVKAYLKCAELRLAVEDDKGALADLNRAIELDPDNAGAYDRRALVKSRLGDKDGRDADRKKVKELKASDD